MSEAGRAAEAAARRSYGKLVALLAARGRDIAAAEDSLADAFAAALANWPVTGIPESPEAWLLAVARRRVIDTARRARTRGDATDHLRLLADEAFDNHAQDEDMPDRRLALMFACAHPAIDESIRAPLILQSLLGFDAAAIGAAFLVPAAAMGQRLVRAKQKIALARIPFRLPEKAEWPQRLDAVLATIYSAYARGWSDPCDASESELAGEAIWLGKLVANLLPEEPEALGLVALMLHLEARKPARRSPAGAYVPLSQQDRRFWDTKLIDAAETALLQAAALRRPGRYQTEAAIQSAHAARRHGGESDWPAIVELYDVLHDMTGSPVVAVNRAMARAQTTGAAIALGELDAALSQDARLASYQPYWAGRAELCVRLGDRHGACDAFKRAIDFEQDEAVRLHLSHRLATLRSEGA